MSKDNTMAQLAGCGVVAVVRAPDSQMALPLAQALAQGGVTSIEITMTTPHAVEVISKLSDALGDKILLGAGTILDAATCADVIHAGARFVVSPIFDAAVVDITRRLGAVSIPGAYTPTEILRAWTSGADLVKVFPAGNLGPGYFRDLLAVMPYLKLTPTGGVDVKTAGAFIQAGAVAVGAGSSLISKAALAAQDFSAITATARQFVDAVRAARQAK